MNYMREIIFATAVVLLFCTGPSVTEGPGGSEITNGKVAAIDGTPVAGLVVSAFPENYIAGSSSAVTVISTVTDADGNFELAIDSGLFNVYMVDTLAGSGCFIRHVGPKTTLGTVRLDTLGSIEGTVRIDSASEAPMLIIFSRGTPLRVNISSQDGLFRFDRVPSGEYALSIAKFPMVGCTPGIDCIPGGGTGTEGLGSVTVTTGTTATVDTLVHAADIRELP